MPEIHSSNNPMIHTYTHRFRNGIKATARLQDDPPSFAVEWETKPGPDILEEYFAWRETILNEFAGRTGRRVLVVNVT